MYVRIRLCYCVHLCLCLLVFLCNLTRWERLQGRERTYGDEAWIWHGNKMSKLWFMTSTSIDKASGCFLWATVWGYWSERLWDVRGSLLRQEQGRVHRFLTGGTNLCSLSLWMSALKETCVKMVVDVARRVRKSLLIVRPHHWWFESVLNMFVKMCVRLQEREKSNKPLRHAPLFSVSKDPLNEINRRSLLLLSLSPFSSPPLQCAAVPFCFYPHPISFPSSRSLHQKQTESAQSSW